MLSKTCYRLYVDFRCKPLRLDGLVLSPVFFTFSSGADDVAVLAGLVWETGGDDASVVISGTARALSTGKTFSTFPNTESCFFEPIVDSLSIFLNTFFVFATLFFRALFLCSFKFAMCRISFEHVFSTITPLFI